MADCARTFYAQYSGVRHACCFADCLEARNCGRCVLFVLWRALCIFGDEIWQRLAHATCLEFADWRICFCDRRLIPGELAQKTENKIKFFRVFYSPRIVSQETAANSYNMPLWAFYFFAKKCYISYHGNVKQASVFRLENTKKRSEIEKQKWPYSQQKNG